MNSSYLTFAQSRKKVVIALCFFIFGGFIFLFQNFSLPQNTSTEIRPLSEPDKTLVGVYYFGTFTHRTNPEKNPSDLFWWRGVKDFFEKSGPAYTYWKKRTPAMQTDHLKPLIGYYDQADISVLEKQIDQAYLAGIDYFNFYFYWSTSQRREKFSVGLNSFIYAKNSQKLKFMVTIYAHPWEPDFFIPVSDFDAIIQTLYNGFGVSNYLRINDRPVISIGDGRAIGNGTSRDIGLFINTIKKFATDRGFPTPIVLMGVGGSKDDWGLLKNTAEGYQCLVPDVRPGSYDFLLTDTLNYFNAVNPSAPLSPCFASGFDERPRQNVMIKDPEQIRYLKDQSLSKFFEGLMMVKNWQSKQTGVASTMINLYAWNEWHEGGMIEPNVRDKYLYLETLQKAYRTRPLRRYLNSIFRVTTLKISSASKPDQGWHIFTQNRPGQNRIAIYECATSSDYFVSLDPRCEGQQTLGLLGYLSKDARSYRQGSEDLVPLYRCNDFGRSHFISSDSQCEGRQTEGLLGFAFKAATTEL